MIFMTPLWTTSVEGRLRFPFHFSITIPSYRRVWEPLSAWAVPESESLLPRAVPGQTGLCKRYRLFALNTLTDLNASLNPGSESDSAILFECNLALLSPALLIGRLICGQWVLISTRPAFRMNGGTWSPFWKWKKRPASKTLADQPQIELIVEIFVPLRPEFCASWN